MAGYNLTVGGPPKGYGRTRRPKALTNDAALTNSQTKEEAKSVTVTTDATTLSAALTSTTAGLNGYSTENQRFLHLQLENDSTSDQVTLYAYNYAFGAWSPFQIRITNGATATAQYVDALFITINGKRLLVLPIEGVDRIAFVHSTDSGAGNLVVRAACSSF